MLYNYAALLIFTAFAAFIPISFLISVKLLSRREERNPIKGSPYESGEVPVGNSRDIDNEYLPHFMIFLPFEMVIAIFIFWSLVAKNSGFGTNLSIVMLGILATVLSFIGYRMVVR